MLKKEGVQNVLSSEPKTIKHGIKSYNSIEEYQRSILKHGIYAIGVDPLET
jgi:ASC-1-like (ASCH) protein